MKQLKQAWLLNSQMSGNTGSATGSADIPVGIFNSPLWRGGIEDDGLVLNSPLNPERMLKRGGCEADGVFNPPLKTLCNSVITSVKLCVKDILISAI
ncbi:hypothetical protein, partial [Maridesulfovibrio ferrireducens]|uniref:hypothetical protein n=1 Tax=Maridesulfovibrio ferrireducens TaxID=246191 RepID=UPI0026F1F7AF